MLKTKQTTNSIYSSQLQLHVKPQHLLRCFCKKTLICMPIRNLRQHYSANEIVQIMDSIPNGLMAI